MTVHENLPIGVAAVAAAFLVFLKLGFGGRTAFGDRRTARWLLDEVGRLASAGASWAEIFEAVNPSRDARLQALLLELRGPHMFAPLTGLRVIEEGCRLALRANAAAGRLDALREAVRSADKVVGYGR